MELAQKHTDDSGTGNIESVTYNFNATNYIHPQHNEPSIYMSVARTHN